MTKGSNTRPEIITDRNGKITTVHKGRTPSKTNSRVAKLPTPVSGTKIEIGTKFLSPYADSMTEFEITSIESNGRVIRAVSSDDSEWGVMEKVFTRNEVSSRLAYEVNVQKAAAKHDEFWNDKPLGAVVHYHNGFGQFVRGIITTDEDGNKAMKASALVGNWRDSDLGIRRPDGEVSYGYNANQVRDGAVFQPHYSNMWESFSDSEKMLPKYAEIVAAGGPDLMPVKNLTVPAMSDEEVEKAETVKVLRDVTNAALSLEATPESINAVRELLDKLEARIS